MMDLTYFLVEVTPALRRELAINAVHVYRWTRTITEDTA